MSSIDFAADCLNLLFCSHVTIEMSCYFLFWKWSVNLSKNTVMLVCFQKCTPAI